MLDAKSILTGASSAKPSYPARKSIASVAALLLIGAIACAEDAPAEAPPADPAAPTGEAGGAVPGSPDSPVPAGEAGAEAAPEAIKEDIAYAYSPIGKRDPFRSLFEQLQKEEQTQQITELQTFEVDQLKLVAIISRIATPYAMVEDPAGKGHTLTRGTLIGKNWGRISEINPDCLVIKEEYRDYTGRKVTNKLNVCLPKATDELKLD